MRVRSIIAVLLLLITGACSTSRKEFDTNPTFAPHFFRKYDVELAWQAERKGQEIVLSGTLTNQRYAYMRDLELTARLMDGKGGVLARETVADFPSYLPPREGAPFRMILRIPTGSAPERLRFSYTYVLTEKPPVLRGYGGHEDTPTFGNLDAPL